MGFMKPKVPTPDPVANAAQDPIEAGASAEDLGLTQASRSLIGTSSAGLRRRASTQRTSLIGG